MPNAKPHPSPKPKQKPKQQPEAKAVAEPHQPRQARSIRAAEWIVSQLERAGVTVVFGVSGGPAMRLFVALEASSIRVVHCKSEQGAVFAADGYARVTGRAGVAVVTSGPGVTNAATGLAVADVDRVPVLLLSGQVATPAFGRGAVQDGSPLGIDVVALTRPVTSHSALLRSPAALRPGLAKALRVLARERRPVHLSLPADLLATEVRWTGPNAARAPRAAQPALTAQPKLAAPLRRALRRLRSAQNVAILAGSGVRKAGASAALLALAERLDAPVATTPKAKGVFPERHPLSLGVFGFGGTRQAEVALLEGELEVLLVAGSSLGEFQTNTWDPRLSRALLIQIDLDRSIIGRNYPALGLVADARAALEALTRGLEARRSARRFLLKRPENDAAPLALERPRSIDPKQLMRELQLCLDELPDAVLACDIGGGTAFALHELSLRPEQDFLLNLGFACMGHALPAALGAALAAPQRPVLALVGDAALAMNGFELHTLLEARNPKARYGGPVCVVLQNGGNGMVNVAARKQYPEVAKNFGLYATQPCLATVARGLGLKAWAVRRSGQLLDALRAALRPGAGPSLIEVHVHPDAEPPIGTRIKGLQQLESVTLGS